MKDYSMLQDRRRKKISYRNVLESNKNDDIKIALPK